MQPSHVASDGPWLAARLGAGTARLRGAFAWRTLAARRRAARVRLGLPGRGAPIRAPGSPRRRRAPRAGAAAVPRRGAARPRGGARGVHAGAAYAAFAERRRGMVREGMDADLTLFAGDVAACPAERLRDLAVTHTIVGGRVEHGPA